MPSRPGRVHTPLLHQSLLRRALDITEADKGKNHRAVALRLNNLAAILLKMERIKEAEPLLRRALEIDEANLPLNGDLVGRDLNNLGALLLQEKIPCFSCKINRSVSRGQ